MAETSPRDDPNGCFWTGCYFSGCPTGYREVSREECFFIHSKHCCPAVTCPAPTPPAGWEVDDDCRLFYNKDADTCPVQCGPGMAGDPSARCNVYGKWEFKGTCTAGATTPVIDFPSLLLFALRSYAAYSPGQQVESGNFSSGLPVFDNRSETRMYMDDNVTMFVDYWRDGTQWVAIRGTASELDWRQNFDLVLAFDPMLGMRLQRGFLKHSTVAMGPLRPMLDPSKAVHLTGHSLGGAVATIVGLKLLKEGFNVTQVVTFGAPKFTDRQGAQVLEPFPALRVTLPDDPVPAWPPLSAYRQAGAEVLLHNDTGGFEFLTAAQATTHDRHSEHFFHALPSFDSHHMLNYLLQVFLRQPKADPVLESALAELLATQP
eukprot:GGOE01003564.1.p1 GENE.GGOE01003564.1~~GGOE01003564.1.p1  ORF type:complete len:403 (-),score=110.92 GGOE01003564.1:299-1423(-)